MQLRGAPLTLPEPQYHVTNNENFTSHGSTNDQVPSRLPIFRIEKVSRKIETPAIIFQKQELPAKSVSDEPSQEVSSKPAIEPSPVKQNLKPMFFTSKEEKKTENPKPSCAIENSEVIMSPQLDASIRFKPITAVERRLKIEKYQQKKKNRKWNKEIVYYSRKMSAEKRVRVCGRFVDKATEMNIQHVHTQYQEEKKKPTPMKAQKENMITISEFPRLEPTGMLPIISKPIFAYTRSVI